MEGPGPEYETLGAFGTMCLINNLNAVSFANDLCNRYGLDTISTGMAVAFVIEAYEKGGRLMVERGELAAVLFFCPRASERSEPVTVSMIIGESTKLKKVPDPVMLEL